MTSIGSSAFYYCSSLTKLYITDLAAWCNVSLENYNSAPFYASGKGTLYVNGTPVTELVIPDSVKSIGVYAFSGCSSLTSITIPDSVKSIGSSAFRGCSSLTSVTIGDSVTSIGSYAFYGCSSLTQVTIGDSVTSIGFRAFDNCSRLTSVTIPDSVTSIGYSAFEDCSSLTSVTIPDSVKSIGPSAFSGCSNLTSVTIPDSVTSIGYSAFSGCSSLESITLPFVGASKSATDYDTLFGYIFGTYSYTGGVATRQYYDYDSYSTYYIPSSLKSITVTGGKLSYGAFYNCSKLTDISLGNGVTSIGSSAFSGCSSLESITLPFVGASKSITDDTLFGYVFGSSSYTGGVATTHHYSSFLYYIPSSLKSVTVTGGNLPYGAFSNCSNLTNITLGDGVTSMGNKVFYGCSCLTQITILSKKMVIYSDSYTFPSNAVIYGYPNSTAQTYANQYSRSFVAIHIWEDTWASNATSHWHPCSDCGKKKDTASHTYDNACDTTCNVCGYERTAPHTLAVYEYNPETHTHQCLCGENKATGAHVYDNDCDADCNVCDYIRTPPHNYNGHWSTNEANHYHMCEGCGSKKDEAPHIYGDVAVCDICFYRKAITGDMNGDGVVSSDDAIYLLRYTLTPNDAPITQSGDMNGDGEVNSNDAIYLLRHTLLPETYPLPTLTN